MNTLQQLAAGLAVAVVLGAGAAQGHSYPVYSTASNQTGNQYLPGLELGQDITVNWTTVINQIGAYTNGSSPITVDLWDITSGTLVDSTVIGTGTPTNGYIYNAITPIELIGGDTYQVEAAGYTSTNKDYNPDQPGGAGQVAFNSLNGAFTEAGAYYNNPGRVEATGATLFPAVTFDKYTTSYGAGSISAAPEPAAWALMLFGVGGMGAAMRSAKRKQPATA